jgi:hypothetical protein
MKENIELLEKFRKELDNSDDPISMLIVINEMWWERYYRKEVVDLPEKISYKTRKHGRDLYIFLDLDKIKESSDWIKLIAELTNLYRKTEVTTAEADENGDPYGWRPLDL